MVDEYYCLDPIGLIYDRMLGDTRGFISNVPISGNAHHDSWCMIYNLWYVESQDNAWWLWFMTDI